MSFTNRDRERDRVRESGDADFAAPIILNPPHLGTMSPPSDTSNWTARLTERYNNIADNLNPQPPKMEPLLQNLIRAQEELREFAGATEFHTMSSHTSTMDAYYNGDRPLLHGIRATRHPLMAWGQLLRALYTANWYLRLVRETVGHAEEWSELIDVILDDMPIWKKEDRDRYECREGDEEWLRKL